MLNCPPQRYAMQTTQGINKEEKIPTELRNNRNKQKKAQQTVMKINRP